RRDQKFFQLMRTLFITPVADPDRIDRFLAPQRMELLDVGSLMKSPGAGDAKAISIDAANGFAKSKHAIDQVQMKFKDLAGIGVPAMVAVMKERDEAILLLERQHAVHYRRLIPLMQQNKLGFLQLLIQELLELIIAGLVKADVELRIDA